jgi:hypothetical protein
MRTTQFGYREAAVGASEERPPSLDLAEAAQVNP